jgi:uncharacterized protein
MEIAQGRAADAAGVHSTSNRPTNRLAREKSPYLLQHAYNPVDWFPWGDEAFETAKREDRPIFLSIGYSTCHWCHVMERESFEDSEVAHLMNRVFVSIKVDREERPDVDHVFMTVCQMMTGSGGWPLNIIMTPDKKPFFAGTYFPKENMTGRIGMVDLTQRVAFLWAERRDEVLESADKVSTALQQVTDDAPGSVPGVGALDLAFQQFSERYDPQQGGFLPAPKFPTPHNLLFLLRHWHRTKEMNALRMVEHTLGAMRRGGLYDHVGFGFHRYSTDAEWLLPHFEKMLYDQAQTAIAYIEAFQATGNADYARTAREIFSYVLRDMSAPEGGFYSAEDADSEGEEGKFYVWKASEIEEVLGDSDARLFSRVFGVSPRGNFRDEATGRVSGTNVLHINEPLQDIAWRLELTPEELSQQIESARARLFAVRERRVHPHKDDKILTDWNGLMIAALARGAQAFGNEEYAAAARRAAEFVLGTLRSADGRLLHRYRDGDAGLPAHADDYAFFIHGLLELYEATFEPRWLSMALELNRDFVDRFWDGSAGGFFFTSVESQELPVRKKEFYDGATPSANSVAACNLVRLARITGDLDHEAKAQEIGRAFAGSVSHVPSGYTQFLLALDFMLGPSHEVVIAGDLTAGDTTELLAAVRKPFVPNKVVVVRPNRDAEITRLAPYTKELDPIGGKATAYVCAGFTCQLPTTDSQKAIELLSAKNP